MMRALLFIIFSLISLPLQAGEISALRIGQHPDKTRLVIELDGESDFQAKISDNPQILNILVRKHDWNLDSIKLLPPFKSIDHTVTTNELLKISLPLDAPYIIQSAFMIEGTPNRLVIDIKPSTNEEFSKNITNIHGPLKMDNTTIKGTTTTTQKPIIMIDAGHGGIDSGAVSPKGITEKQITLPLAKKIAIILNQSGRYDAQLTRDSDTFIKLYDRVKIARESDANLFISIHADSVDEKNVGGASVYTLSTTASDSQTEQLAFRENNVDKIGGFNVASDNKQINDILFDLSTRETMDDSKTLANLIVQDFQNNGIALLKSPHRYAGFAVLTAPDVPSILIETGFVSNNSEAEKLLTSDHQTQIAMAIKDALDGYFGF